MYEFQPPEKSQLVRGDDPVLDRFHEQVGEINARQDTAKVWANSIGVSLADSERTWATTYADGNRNVGYRRSKSVTGGDGTVRYMETHFDNNKPGDLKANYTTLVSSRKGAVKTEYDDGIIKTIQYPDGGRFEGSDKGNQWLDNWGKKIEIAKNLPKDASYEDEMKAIQKERQQKLDEIIDRAPEFVHSRGYLPQKQFSDILSQKLEEIDALGGKDYVDKFMTEIAKVATGDLALHGEYFTTEHGLKQAQIKDVNGKVITSGDLLPIEAHEPIEFKAFEFIPKKYIHRLDNARFDPYAEREADAYAKEYKRRGLPKPQVLSL